MNRYETKKTIRYETDEAGRRETISHREGERRRSSGMGEVRRRTTQRQRTDEQVRGAKEKGDIRVANAQQIADIRRANAAGGRGESGSGAGSIAAGIIRVFAVVIILAMLFLVLSHPSSSTGLVGSFGNWLYNFTNSTDPLFKPKGQAGTAKGPAPGPGTTSPGIILPNGFRIPLPF